MLRQDKEAVLLAPSTVCVCALLKHTLLFTEDLPSLCPSQPGLTSWLLTLRVTARVGAWLRRGSERGCSRHCQMANTGDRTKGAAALLPHWKKSLVGACLPQLCCGVGKGKAEQGQGRSPGVSGAAQSVGLGTSPLGCLQPCGNKPYINLAGSRALIFKK